MLFFTNLLIIKQVKKESVTVLPFTTIAPQKTMYQDVCSLILKKNTALVIVPFTRKNSLADVETPRGMSGAFLPLVLEQVIERKYNSIRTHMNYNDLTSNQKAWSQKFLEIFG